jgi:hypothetical protein
MAGSEMALPNPRKFQIVIHVFNQNSNPTLVGEGEESGVRKKFSRDIRYYYTVVFDFWLKMIVIKGFCYANHTQSVP